MSIRQFFFYAACACSVGVAAQTADPANAGRSGPVSLAQALQAAKANAQARLAQQSLAAASADILAADRPPLPVFSAKAASTSDSSGAQARYDKSFGLDWTVERGDKRLHRTAAAKFGAQAAQSELAETVLLQQLQAKDLFFELLTAQERVQHLQSIAQGAEQTAAAARLRLKAGDLSAQDTVRVEIEAERARSDLARAQADQKRASLALAQGLGWAGSAASPLSAQAEWPDAASDVLAATASLEAWIASRPDIKAYELRASAAQAALDNARALGKIDPTVGLSLDSSGASNRRLAELRVQFPLQVRSTYDGEIGRAMAQFEQAQTLLEQARLAAQTQWQGMRSDYVSALARYNAYGKDILPRAQKVAAQAEFAYSKGAIPLVDLLDARRTLKASLLEALDVQQEFAKAFAALQIRSPKP